MLSAALRIVLGASVAAVNLLAQASFTGTILGTVTDPAGAVGVGAAVSISNLATNELHRVQTDGSGNYFVPNLKPGAYSVSVEASGFKRFIQDRVPLQIDQRARVDAGLVLGSTSEVVEVTGTAPVL